MPARPNTVQSWRDTIKKVQSFRLPTRAELLHAGEAAAIALDSMRREFQRDPVPFFAPAFKPRAEAAFAGDWPTALGPIAGPNDILMGAASRDPSRAIIEARLNAIRDFYGAPEVPASPPIYSGYGEQGTLRRGASAMTFHYAPEAYSPANARRVAERVRVNPRLPNPALTAEAVLKRLPARLQEDLSTLPSPTKASVLAAAGRHPRLVALLNTVVPIERANAGPIAGLSNNLDLALPMNTFIAPPITLHELTHVAQNVRNWPISWESQTRITSPTLLERAREYINHLNAGAEIPAFIRDQTYSHTMTPSFGGLPLDEVGYVPPQDLFNARPNILSAGELYLPGTRRGGLLVPVNSEQLGGRVNRNTLPIDASLRWLAQFGAKY